MVLFCKAFVAFWGKIIIPFFQFYFFSEEHNAKVSIYYLVWMIVLVKRGWIRKGFSAIALWPFVILKHKGLAEDEVFMNHERIHLRQQLELLVVLFYLWYGIEFFVRWIQMGNRKAAYHRISFEREAYGNEKDLHYLKKRSFWQFLKYT